MLLTLSGGNCYHVLINACVLTQEAGARISTMDGKPYTVFDRSVLASNGRLHDAVRWLSNSGSCCKPS